ncbi:hypothetical protein D3C75_765060 [compost metagenome]
MLQRLPTQQLLHFLHQQFRPANIGIRQQQCELLAPIAHSQVGRPLQRLLQHLGKAPQALVARGVPITVVVGLEVIQVEHHQRQRIALASRPAQLRLEHCI